LLDGLGVNGDTARPLAVIHLARGEHALAREVLTHALTAVDPTITAAVPLLATLVDVELASGDADAADAVAQQLATIAAEHGGAFARAEAAFARGRVCAKRGDGDVVRCLREALSGFSAGMMPLEMARCRLELATVLAGERPDAAVSEARAALQAFERLNAPRHADAAAAVLRSLGVRPAPRAEGYGVLTGREREVLTLLGEGLSNPEIADRLYISRKTVEHHVGNVLAKLGLRSRAEAAAYAVRTKPGTE
jgi:DNA-binding NarL/FixJ family response regulator